MCYCRSDSLDPDGTHELEPIQVIIADLDQNGFGDIVTANHAGSSISVLINRLTIVSNP